jgi:hypothetical protein
MKMARWHRIKAFLEFVVKRRHTPGWLRTAIGASILIIVLGFFIRYAEQTLSAIRHAWQPVNWFCLIMSLLVLLVCLLLMALMWYGVMRTVGGRLPLPKALSLYGLTLLPRYVPGMVWGYAGRTLLCEREGIPRKIAAVSVTVEVALIVSSGALVAMMRYMTVGMIILISFPGILLLFGFLLAWLMHQSQWIKRLWGVTIWYGWLWAYIGFWVLYGTSSWLIASSVVSGVKLSSSPDIIASATLAWLAGFLVVFTPGGLGIREGVWALTLTPIVGNAGGAVLIPLIARVIGMVSEVLFSIFCLILFHGRSPIW